MQHRHHLLSSRKLKPDRELSLPDVKIGLPLWVHNAQVHTYCQNCQRHFDLPFTLQGLAKSKFLKICNAYCGRFEKTCFMLHLINAIFTRRPILPSLRYVFFNEIKCHIGQDFNNQWSKRHFLYFQGSNYLC